MSNPISAIGEAEKLLNKVVSVLKLTNDEILQISKNARKASSNFLDIKTPKELNEQLKVSRELQEKLTKAYEDQKSKVSSLQKQINALKKARRDNNKVLSEEEKLIKKLGVSKERLALSSSKENIELIKTRLETQRANKEIKNALLLNSKYATSYEKLSAKHRKASATLKNLVASEKASNSEIKKAQREFDILDKKIRKADNAANDFRRDVGKYKNALGPAVGLVRNLTAAFGIYSGLEIAKTIFEEIKALNALEEALKKVTDSEIELNQVQQFLKVSAEQNGVEIKGLTKEYIKYLAALKGTNLQGTKGEQIFSKVVKASSALGNTQDETNGILNALVQIISKGTVQAEELRGQLGDRLPGAVNIMARALGVGTSELNKMLEQGQLIADEVLPKFADELERTFGLENVNKIETLVAAQNRLSNSWSSFVGSLESGSGRLSKTFKFLIDQANTLIKGFERLALSTQEENDKLFNESKAKSYAEALSQIDKAVAKNKTTREEEAKVTFEANIERFKQLSKEKKLLEEKQLLLKKQVSELNIFNSVQRNGINKQIKENEERLVELSVSLGLYEGQLSAAQSVMSDYYSLQIKSTQQTGKEAKETEKKNKFLKNSIGYYEDIIRKLKEQQTNTSKSSKDFAEFEHQIQVIRNIIRNLKGDFEQLEEISLSDAFAFFDAEEEVSNEIDLLKEIINTKIKDAGADIEPLKILIDSAEGIEDLEKLYAQLNELDKQYKKQRVELQQELSSELQDLATTLTDSLFQIEAQKYDERIERNNNYYDSLLNNEELSDEQRKAYQRARDQENERLEKERAEVQKRAFLVEQAVKLTQIVIDTAQKVAAIKAQAALLSSNPATAAFAGVALAQIPLVIATGAVAGATIAAQTIPAFKDGKPESNNHSGPAWVGDGGRREVIYNPNTGQIGVTPDTPTLTNLKSDDIVYKSIPDAIDNIGNTALLTSMYSQGLNNYQTDRLVDTLLSKYQGQITREFSKGFDKMKKLKINNNIYISSDKWGSNSVNSKYKG